LILGALFVFLDWRLAAVATLGVPISFASAMMGASLLDVSINMMSLLAFIVVLGMLDDDSVVVAENIYRHLEMGKPPVRAAIEASRLRLRPIVMTSIAFIAGVVPLAFSVGAGAEMRQAMGIAVFAGMIGVTAFGIFLTPVFYVLMRALSGNRPLKRHGEIPHDDKAFAPAGGDD